MNKQRRYFSNGQKLFWILLLVLVVFSFLHLADKMFKSDGIAEAIVKLEKPEEQIAIDTSSVNPKRDTLALKNDSILYTWQWVDFDGNNNNIKFYLHKDDLSKAQRNRSGAFKSFLIYSTLFNHDKKLLNNLISKMKQNIKQKKLSYFEAAEYVCSSIQFIPYTLVLADFKCPCRLSFGDFSGNCKVQDDGRGCCNGVFPFGVYSPIEFTCLKTGDCDTRSLLAYTFLKEMGFDVAVMVSEKEGHSVLGLSLPDAGNYSYGVNNYGKKFALWELTSKEWRFGIPVDGNDWIAALE